MGLDRIARLTAPSADRAAPGSIASVVSIGCVASLASVGSIASLGSVGSIASIGSVGSIASTHGVGAVLNVPVAEMVAAWVGRAVAEALRARTSGRDAFTS